MKNKNVKKKIKEYFFLNPTIKLRVRQIERKAKVPLPSVIRYTKELEEENILKKEVISNIKIYSANRISKKFLVEKKLYNIYSLFSSGLVDFFIKELNNPTVVVFGSYAKGEDVESSDIDIYIETARKEDKEVKLFENKLNRDIQMFRHKKIKDVKNKELANNIVNGVILNGFLEVFE